MSSLTLFIKMGNILALLWEETWGRETWGNRDRDLGKSAIAMDFDSIGAIILIIKFDSIGAIIFMLDLIIVVGILSQTTLLLCLRLVMILVISGIDDGWKYTDIPGMWMSACGCARRRFQVKFRGSTGGYQMIFALM